MSGQTRYIIDTNKHGIRRERPAVGYKAVKELNKRNKKKAGRRKNAKKTIHIPEV